MQGRRAWGVALGYPHVMKSPGTARRASRVKGRNYKKLPAGECFVES